MKILPPARITEIVVQELGRELLVYDLTLHHACQLNETAATVFNACDGRQTFDDLKIKYNFTDAIIYLALDELKKQNLLAGDYASPFAGMSRRAVIRQAGLASMIALPVISGLVAPQALQAASDRNAICGPLNVCRSGNTPFCPPGCTAIINTIFYFGSYDGSCTGTGSSGVQDCSRGQGITTGFDYKRTA